MSNTQPTITPEVGKRYVTRGGWVTPPLEKNDDYTYRFKAGGLVFDENGCYHHKHEKHPLDLISEYVEPTKTILQREYVVENDTYRRDLEAALFVAMIGNRDNYTDLAKYAIKYAAALIEAQEEAK